ncbi:MAG: hypothetical protein QM817_27300 [Archangium sp.]
MTATCATHAVASTGTCERCGTFYCEQCRAERLCTTCAQRPAPPPGRLALVSLIFFGLGVLFTCLPVFGLVAVLAFPVGLVLGAIALTREPQNWPLALLGVLLNGIVCAGALYAGFASGWAA